MNHRSLAFRLARESACAAFAVVLSAALPAVAQISRSGSGSVPQAPYTVEFRITRVQTLADGGTITRETKEVVARDSQGRTLRATTQISASDGQPGITFTFVHDPVENTEINWDSRTRQAHITKMPPQDELQGCWATSSGGTMTRNGGRSAAVLSGGGGGVTGSSSLPVQLPDSPPSPPASAPRPAPIRPQREDLGDDTILGVEVHGTRITHTVPVGRIGNDVPLVTTSEIWSAPSLGLTLREISDST
ncbi:MAG TPA: hypothetical protein VMD55_00390, partial [Terracidiphilus sp.]|nr:hypothetical protein [Terracidiphilus sp.]